MTGLAKAGNVLLHGPGSFAKAGSVLLRALHGSLPDRQALAQQVPTPTPVASPEPDTPISPLLRKVRAAMRDGDYASAAAAMRAVDAMAKRADPVQQEQPSADEIFAMLDSQDFEALLGQIERQIERGEIKEDHNMLTDDDYQNLHDEVEALLGKARRALAELDDDDDNASVKDTWSEHADAKAKGNNASLDDDGDDDDDDNGSVIRKAERFVHEHANMGPVNVDREHRFGPTRHLADWPATAPPKKHKFEARVDFVQERDGVDRTSAMSRARQEFPETYADYQDFTRRQSTSAQAAARGLNRPAVKRAATTYEDLVAAQMAKGCTMEVAGQRVMQQYGSAALHNRALGKSSDPALITKRLEARIDEVVADTGCERTEALRALRKSGEYYW
jgi:hypothetical protein